MHQHQGPGGFLRHHQTVSGNVQDADFPLRMLVQSDMIGAIIGRSGNTIKQITQQSKARIDVHRDESQDQQEKVISISGTPDSCTAACFIILKIIMKEKAQVDNKDASSNNNVEDPTSAKNDDNFDDNDVNVVDTSLVDSSPQQQQQQQQHMLLPTQEVRLKLLAHNNFIGRLIGRSGVSIKKIMETTSTKISVSVSNLADLSHERIITVLGDLEHVRQAEQIISYKLRAAFVSDMNNTLQNMNHQQSYLFNNVPAPYMPRPYPQNPLLSSLVNSHTGHTLSRTGVPVGPHHQSQLTGPSLYPGAPSYLSMYPNISVPPTGHGLLGFNSAVPGLESEKETVNIYIPNIMVGAIIGKSGSAIKEMIINSGASIRVAAAPSQPATGSTMAYTLAKDENASQQQQETNNKTDSSAPTQTSDSSNQDEVLSDSQTPAVSSPQQRTLSSRQTTALADSQIPTRKVTIVGTPESQWSAQYLIYRKISIENNKSDTSLMVEIQVPSYLVGRIIGKGGVTVKQIQKQTRTTIRLPDEKPPSSEIVNYSETSVQITGEFNCSQLAQRHIRNLIKKNFQTKNNNNNRPNQNNNRHNENSNIAAKSPNAQASYIDNKNHQQRSDNESVSTLDEEDNTNCPNEIC